MTYTETDLVATIEQLSGDELAALSQPRLDGIDQFHAGGAEAVDRLLPSLGLIPSMTVLDVGSGLGGPARQVARSTGCAVVGVDITQSYVDTARALTEAAGLSEQVDFRCADIAEVERADFDAAYTMHVQMNVEDKPAFFSGIAKRLRPGARLATFEVCRRGPDDPVFPTPWSIDGSDSFLATPADLHTIIRAQRVRDGRVGRRDRVDPGLVRGARRAPGRRRVRSNPVRTPDRRPQPHDELRGRPQRRHADHSPRRLHARAVAIVPATCRRPVRRSPGLRGTGRVRCSSESAGGSVRRGPPRREEPTQPPPVR